MLHENLDPQLESGIACICDNDWPTAQQLLSQRLDRCAQLGFRRLNLFLLSTIAARSGHSRPAEELREAADNTPLQLAEPRYFGSDSDPVRRELERAWWAFNSWNAAESLPSASSGVDARPELDWAAVLDGALEGRAGELERRWSAYLDDDHPQRAVLWNLVALGHLESGDLRTYEEMREQSRSTSPTVLPQELVALLQQAGLSKAVTDLENGIWLTSDRLTVDLASIDSSDLDVQNLGSARDRPESELSSVEPVPNGLSRGWVEQMESVFSLLSVGRAAEAARSLGPLSLRTSDLLLRALTLNALSLALFLSGEYQQAQEALDDSRETLTSAPPDSEHTGLFVTWLGWVGVRPTPGDVLCDPFQETTNGGATSSETDTAQSDAVFWSEFELLLQTLGRDPGSCRGHLRSMLSEPVSREATRAFLMSLLFAGIGVLLGDHFDAQEAIDEATSLLQAGGFDPTVLAEAQLRFQAAGASAIAAKLTSDRLESLDPWHDFPNDFVAPV